jgi:hypothetical protein
MKLEFLVNTMGGGWRKLWSCFNRLIALAIVKSRDPQPKNYFLPGYNFSSAITTHGDLTLHRQSGHHNLLHHFIYQLAVATASEFSCAHLYGKSPHFF